MLRHTLLRCSLLCRRSSAAVAAATASNRGSYRSQSTSARELLSGVFAPIPTPFSLDKPNELDLPRLSTNLARWLGSGAADKHRMVDGVCVMGSNGEFPLLREAEKRALLAHVSAQVRSIDGDGSVRLIAGTGSVSTLETIELTQFAADHGYDAAMVVTPYYYTSRMTQARLAQHFIAVANAASIPIILYRYILHCCVGRDSISDSTSTVVVPQACHRSLVDSRSTRSSWYSLPSIRISLA